MADPSPLAQVLINKKLVNMPPALQGYGVPDLAARTAYGEASGDPASEPAVLDVIINRILSKQWGSPEETMFAPNQFSTWNPDDPNGQRAMNVPREDPHLAQLRQMAMDRLLGNADPKRPTAKAMYYHALKDPKTGQPLIPKWDYSKLQPIGPVGQQTFYSQK